MCRKATLLESQEVNQSSIDAEGQRADIPPTGEDRARAERAKVMEERRRELEQSISQAQIKSKQRSGDQAAGKQKVDAKSRGGQDAAKKKRKRSESSRSIGEVLAVGEENSVNVSSKAAEEVQVETIPTRCIVESRGKLVTENLFDQN
jgi:hypothetical protein